MFRHFKIEFEKTNNFSIKITEPMTSHFKKKYMFQKGEK